MPKVFWPRVLKPHTKLSKPWRPSTVLKGFYDLLGGSRPDLMVLESLVDTHNQKAQEKKAYLLQPEIFASIIQHGYGKKYQGNWLFFSYDAIDVLAEINGLHVIIKQLSANNTYDTVHEYPVDNGEVVIMLHTMAGTEGGFCPGKNQTLNHFNLLSLHRGVLISPIITYKNLRNVNKSKSTSVGVSASPGGAIPGTASFSHNSQNTQTDTLATISSNFHVETKSDISGINRDANNTTKKIKDSKTHVEAFVPLVNPMDIPKLWDRAVDNFNGAIDKPLWTPEEKPAVLIPHKKEEAQEEPKDTTVTDEEVDGIIDDLEVEGKKQEVEKKAQERKAAEKTEAEKTAAAESILDAPIKPETDFLLYSLDSDIRGRSQEREVVQESRTKEPSPTKIDDTYIEKGKDALSRGIEECYEGRESLFRGEISFKTVAQGMAAQTLDNLAQLPKFIDTVTLGYASKAGDLIDSGFVALETGVRRSVRYTTGNQQMGQDSGQIVYALAGLIGPKKYLPPLQLITKVLPATKVAAVTKTLETLVLGKAANTERKVLQGLDLAEVNYQLPNVGTEFGRRPKGHIRTNEELIQDIATRAEREIGGSGRIPGIKKHTYSKEVLAKHQEMFGDRSIQFEKNWRNGKTLDKGDSTKGSVRLDVYDESANIVYDYKFVQNPGKGLKNDQVRRIKQNVRDNAKVTEVNPIKK